MKKKVNNIKRMGVKSIHYYDSNVIIENSLAKNIDDLVLYDVKYNNIETLDRVLGKVKNYQHIKFNDLKDSGFTLKGNNCVSKVTNVKNLSFSQSIFGISNNNNIEIQIHHNIDDIKKIISFYCNHVIYSLNSTSENAIKKQFDEIGMLPSFKNFNEYENKNKNVYFILKSYKSIINIPNDLFYDDIDYSNFFYYSHNKPKYNAKVNQILMQISDDMYDDENKRNKLINAKNVFLSFEKEKANIKIKELLKRKNNINLCEEEKDLLFVLNEIISIRYIYDYLRLISAIRQYCVHNDSLKHSSLSSQVLFKLANKKMDTFNKQFVKNNEKYVYLFEKTYKLFGFESLDYMLKEFYQYSIFDKGKNLAISIKTISKLIRKEDNELELEYLSNTLKINAENHSEYLSKYKNILDFYLYTTLKDKLEEYIFALKTTRNKEKVYQKISKEIVMNDYKKLQTIKKQLINCIGKIKKNKSFNSDIGNFITIKSNSWKLMYVFSLSLTKKEANDMFSQILNKIDAIYDLINLSKKVKKESNYKIVSYSDFIIDLDDLDNIKLDILLIRSIRNKDKIDVKSNVNFMQICNCFKLDDYNIEILDEDLKKDQYGKVIEDNKSRQSKPLKNFLRNNVYQSKQYQIISKYTQTNFCTKIMSSKKIISFVLTNMMEETPELLQYLSKIYSQYTKKKGIEINNTNINLLIEALYNLKFKHIVNSAFNKKIKNYLALVPLYLNVCYLVIKNMININSAYFQQMRDYERLYKSINGKVNIEYNLSVNKKYIEFLENNNKKVILQNKNNTIVHKSYCQLKKLLSKYSGDYLQLYRAYRNEIEHVSCLSRIESWDILNSKEISITSYFQIFQIIIQNNLFIKNERYFTNALIDSFDSSKKDKRLKQFKTQGYLQRIINIVNLPFAYNISRYNNLTIEKYFIKRFKEEK